LNAIGEKEFWLLKISYQNSVKSIPIFLKAYVMENFLKSWTLLGEILNALVEEEFFQKNFPISGISVDNADEEKNEKLLNAFEFLSNA